MRCRGRWSRLRGVRLGAGVAVPQVRASAGVVELGAGQGAWLVGGMFFALTGRGGAYTGIWHSAPGVWLPWCLGAAAWHARAQVEAG